MATERMRGEQLVHLELLDEKPSVTFKILMGNAERYITAIPHDKGVMVIPQNGLVYGTWEEFGKHYPRILKLLQPKMTADED